MGQRVGRGEEATKGAGVRRYLCRQRPLGGFPLVLARFVEGLSTHQSAGCPWRLEDRQSRGFQGVRGGAREAVAMLTRRIPNK